MSLDEWNEKLDAFAADWLWTFVFILLIVGVLAFTFFMVLLVGK